MTSNVYFVFCESLERGCWAVWLNMSVSVSVPLFLCLSHFGGHRTGNVAHFNTRAFCSISKLLGFVCVCALLFFGCVFLITDLFQSLVLFTGLTTFAMATRDQLLQSGCEVRASPQWLPVITLHSYSHGLCTVLMYITICCLERWQSDHKCHHCHRLS